jgi:hypothetical protein
MLIGDSASLSIGKSRPTRCLSPHRRDGEKDHRLVYYEIADAKRLIEAMAQPYAVISAAGLAF